MSLFSNTTVTVELAGLPPLTLALDDSAGEASPLLKALRPRVTLVRNGVVLLRHAPYGSPEDGVPWGLVVAGGALLAVLLLLAE